MPGRVAAELGPAAILAYLVRSVAVALVFLCFAEVDSRVTRSGGAYAYIEEAFGPFAGLIAVYVFLTAVNIRGAKAGVRVYVFNTVAKLVPLLLLLVAGLFAINVENLAIPAWPSAQEVGAGAIMLFFAFTEAECALSASGEVRNPSRTVPLGLLLGISGVLVLYVGLQTVAQGVLGPELANQTEAPLVAAALEVFGDWGGKMLLAGVVISIYGAISGDMLSAPRVIFASSLDDNLPRFLSKVHPKYKTPHVAVIFFAALVCAFAVSGTFRYLAVFATGSLLLVDLGVVLGVLRLRQRDGLPGAEQFRLPFGALIPLAACLIVGWLLLQVPAGEALSIAGLIEAWGARR